MREQEVREDWTETGPTSSLRCIYGGQGLGFFLGLGYVVQGESLPRAYREIPAQSYKWIPHATPVTRADALTEIHLLGQVGGGRGN